MAEVDFAVFNKPPASLGSKQVLHNLPRNPADKCTIVSIFPKEIIEVKPTLVPGRFVIPAAPANGFAILLVEGSSYYLKSQMERMPPTEVQVNSAQLAESIIRDNIGAYWLSTRGVRSPGVFWVPGGFSMKTIVDFKSEEGRTFPDLIDEAKERQKKWFIAVMEGADEFWARSNGNPRSIPEDARIAAVALGQDKTKPWMQNTIASILEHCPSCGEMINKAYPTCRYCHAVHDPAKAKLMGLQFAPTGK